MNIDIVIPLLAATVQSGTPILYATLGEILTERSGTLNLGVEGMMIVGALGAFLTAMFTGSPTLAVLVGGLSASLLGSLHGLVCFHFMGNQVVSGLALTILGTGLANYLGTPFVGRSAPGFDPLRVPILENIPILGPILFRQDILVYASLLTAIGVWFLLTKTRWGLHIRAVGEHPEAARTTGLNVPLLRWSALVLGTFLAGVGGAYLSLAYTHLWTNNLTAGRGWIAVALVIFAFWRPGRAVFGAYLFGGVMAWQFRLQATGTTLPSSLLMMLPYALTVIALVMASRGRGVREAPAALGVNVEPAD
ncbi:MAG: ABC transporter permease [Deltaproteobacteria bacterium]|nr:ABC transporter permease [Deltaproteobacteria bacterium]